MALTFPRMTRNVAKRVIMDIKMITIVIPMVIILGKHNHQECAKNGLKYVQCCKDGFLDG